MLERDKKIEKRQIDTAADTLPSEQEMLTDLLSDDHVSHSIHLLWDMK